MRTLFDMPDNISYLNAAYMTPLTKKQVEIGASRMDACGQPWTMPLSDFFDPVEGVREKAAAIMNVQADDVALIASVSYGMASAARNLHLKEGSAIVMLEGQFPSNVYEWQKLAEQQNCSIHFVPTPDDDNWTQALLEYVKNMKAPVGLFALPNIHWSSGAVIDLLEVRRVATEQSAYLVLDLTQSLGAMPTDISAIDPDFAIAAGYKWLMGPYGLGVMYVAKRHQDGEPLEQNWIVRKGSENFAGLINYQSEYQAGARRFDVGEKSNFILTPMFEEGLRLLLEWGIPDIAKKIAAINSRLADAATDYGFRVIGQSLRSPNMLGIHMAGKGAEVLKNLSNQHVFTSLRGDTLRVSPHLWVTSKDEDRFIAVLNKSA